jgi:hypothetical protein
MKTGEKASDNLAEHGPVMTLASAASRRMVGKYALDRLECKSPGIAFKTRESPFINGRMTDNETGENASDNLAKHVPVMTFSIRHFSPSRPTVECRNIQERRLIRDYSMRPFRECCCSGFFALLAMPFEVGVHRELSSSTRTLYFSS